MTTDYGPLTQLIGTFKGNKGTDIAPDPDGIEENIYEETIVFSEAGCTENAEQQELAALHYHVVIYRISDGKMIHNQTGYWGWDQAKNQIIQSIVLPRVVCVLATGSVTSQDDNKIVIDVATDAESCSADIIQSPFMHKKAKTTSFKMTLTIQENEIHYHQTTLVDIYGKSSFEHTDTNTLTKV